MGCRYRAHIHRDRVVVHLLEVVADQQGGAPLGIVYGSDAASDPEVEVVGTFPEDSHPPIIYPAALIKESRNPDAAALLTYLRSPAARGAFERQGFTPVGTPGAGH